MTRELTLQLKVRAERVEALEVMLPRLDTRALLRGRAALETATLLPTVLSVCAQAQGAAAAGALWAAQSSSQGKGSTSIALPPLLAAGYALAVRLESMQESLRSLCLGLPEMLRTPSLLVDFGQCWRIGAALLARLQHALQAGWQASWQQAWPETSPVAVPSLAFDATALQVLTLEVRVLAQAWDGFCTKHVHGAPTALWQGQHSNADACIEQAKTPVLQWFALMAQEVPTLGRATLQPLPLVGIKTHTVPWADVVSAPYDASGWSWVQTDARMQPVAARLGNSVAARLWARLVDVACTLAALQNNDVGSSPIDTYAFDGEGGVATVVCARGVLVHRVCLQEQRVVSYEMHAPTDWNFHRDGALSSLLGWPAVDRTRLHQHATWLVQMLDPCVAFKVEIKEA